MAKDKKYKGGPARKSYLQNMAKQGGRSGDYSKYGDIDPKDVHTGTATYRGSDATDDPSTSRMQYSVAVKRGHSKDYFRFQGKLYKITHAGGNTNEEVKV